MERKQFEETLKNNNALRLTDDLLLFNDLDLYNLKTDLFIKFKDYEELYNFKVDDKTISELIEEKEVFTIEYNGGRGSGSSNSEMGGGFTSADQRYKSYDKTLQQFEKMYKGATIEYGASVDEQGFAHRLIRGGSTSVPISGAKGEMIIHNHPSGGNFSKQDLISIASGSEKGIVAVGSNVSKQRMRYSLVKGKNFKAKEFTRAVNKAQWPKNYDYDKGADWWLKKNAKQFGYKYSAVKIK